MKQLLILFFTLYFGISSYSQTSINQNTINIPQESIFLHHNSTFLITGEFLYYKIYCLNSESKKLSKFSKTAYVELINSEFKSVFKHKINLHNGIGEGDYFIPTDIPSGNYKIVAYTQWMRNGSIDNFYQNDISIINPFQRSQKTINKSNQIEDSIIPLSKTSLDKSNANSINKNSIKLNLSSLKYGTREKVTLQLSEIIKDFYGVYSISVRKIDTIGTFNKINSEEFVLLNSKKEINQINTSQENIVLPELRGELIKGKVYYKDSKAPASNVKVALSIPGENFIFKVSNSNHLGNFYFNLDKEYEGNKAKFQVIDEFSDKYDYNLNLNDTIDFSSLEFEKFSISPSYKNIILNHSINNQIENAYSSVKIDSIINITNNPPFYANASKQYVLDDFTRFTTIKETILEVVEEAFVKQKNNEYSIHVRVYDDNVESDLKSLLLVDGLFIQNHTDIVNSKANKIKKISVVNEQYIYGSQIFEGIIFMETFNGNYGGLSNSGNEKNIDLFAPNLNKKYFNQVYSEKENLNRIPDFRLQLVWEPSFAINNNAKSYSFYTSDIIGDFEISLEGINENGLPISIREVITVE